MKRRFISIILILGLVAFANSGLAARSDDVVTTVIDGKTSDRVHLREEPSTNSKSLGLYFTGTEVHYIVGTNGEWVWVNIGNEAGYIKTEFLYSGNNPGSVTPKQPKGTINNRTGSNWVNMRYDPTLNGKVASRLYNGDTVTVLGETVTKWYYVKSGDLYGYVMADFLQVGDSNNHTGTPGGGTGGTPPSGNPSKTTTITVNPKDSVQAYATIKNCTLNIVPTDGTMVACTYDTSVLRFGQSMSRGVLMITVESISGKRIKDNAIATLNIPRALFNAVFVDVQNGEASIAGGIDSHMDISGNGARVSVYYPADNTHNFLMRFVNSTCVFGISENAADYAISVQQVTDSSINVPNRMPSNKGNGPNVGYEYVNGNGSTEITVDALKNSTLEFAFVR